MTNKNIPLVNIYLLATRMFKKCYTRKYLLQAVSDKISNILCNGIVDRYFFSIIINYDDLVSILVSIFQITMGDNHMKRLFNPLFNTLFACQIFNIMKKMIFLSILSIPFATMRGMQGVQDQKGQTEFDKQIQAKFAVIDRCVDDYIKNKKEILCGTPLRKAAYAGDTECVKSFLDDFFQEEINVNNRCYKDSKTLLHIAAQEGYVDMVDMLLNRGADPDIKSSGKAALHLVAESRKPMLKAFAESANHLINKGATVDMRSDNWNNRKTPLHFAAEFRNTDTLNVLLERGADVLTRDNSGMTAEDGINHDLQTHNWQWQPTHNNRQAETEIRPIMKL